MMPIKKAPCWRTEHGVSENDHYVPIVSHVRRRHKRRRVKITYRQWHEAVGLLMIFIALYAISWMLYAIMG